MTLTVRNGIYEIQDELTKEFVECRTRLEARNCLYEMGIHAEAIDEAFEYILEHGHRTAVFGIKGTFIFSEK